MALALRYAFSPAGIRLAAPAAMPKIPVLQMAIPKPSVLRPRADPRQRRAFAVSASQRKEAEKVAETTRPLDAETFRALPPTLQKMSVMGKVIVVTG